MELLNEKPLTIIEIAFGSDVYLSNVSMASFPFVFSSNFKVFKGDGDKRFIYVVPTSDLVPFELVQNMYAKCMQTFQKQILVYLYDARKKNKALYQDARINYIASDGEVALFEGEARDGVALMDDSVGTLSYTKTTQLIVNFYLSNEIREYTTREVAAILGLSFAGVSRANAFLFDIGALYKLGNHTGSRYLLKSKKELLEKVKPFLIYPIKNRRIILADASKITNLKGYLSGESALSYYTQLEPKGSFIELAFDSAAYHELVTHEHGHVQGEQICYLEEFIYNPSCFSNSRIISWLDAYIIARKRYQHSDDPRVLSAIAALERELVHDQNPSSGEVAH